MNRAAGAGPSARVIAVCLIGTFAGTFIASSVSVALPDVGADLGLSFSGSLWVAALYLVVVAILLVPLGALADARGRSRCYLAGLALIGVGSLAAGLAQAPAALLAARAVQGVGGACVAATASALVVSAFPPAQRGRALGWNVMAVYLGFSLGPTLGAFALHHLGWRALFLLNVPVVLGALLAGWRLGLARRDVEPVRFQLDVPGLAALATAISTVVVALTFAPLWGLTAAPTLLLGAIALAAFAAFVTVELRVAAPLLDLRLFRDSRAFALGNAGTLASSTALFGVAPLVAVFLRVAHGASAQLTGLVLLLQPLMMTIFSPLAGRLSDRVDGRRLMAGGMIGVALALVAGSLAPAGIPAWWVAGVLGLVGLGAACFGAPNNAVVYGAVARSQLGLAAGVIGTMRYLGQALSLALLGGIVVSQLGATGGELLYVGGAGAGSQDALELGMRLALAVAAGCALIAALLSSGLPARTAAPRSAVVAPGAPS